MPTSPLDAYLNGVLAKLLAQSPVKGVPARVYVRASGDWAAKSTADANIYVALGTLLRLDNEDEVAALLGHEASHVILGHANADVVQGVQQRAIQLSALAAAAQGAVAGGKGGGGKAVAGSARVQEQSRALLLNTMLLVAGVVARAGARRRSARHRPAGARRLLAAGDGVAAAQAEDLRDRARRRSAGRRPSTSSSASTPTQKVQEQTAKATKNMGDRRRRARRARRRGARLGAGVGLEEGATRQSRSHPKTEERITEIDAYVADEYADAAAPAWQVETWEAAKDADGTVDILENYIAAIEAKGKLVDGDVAAARKLAKTEPQRADQGARLSRTTSTRRCRSPAAPPRRR